MRRARRLLQVVRGRGSVRAVRRVPPRAFTDCFFFILIVRITGPNGGDLGFLIFLVNSSVDWLLHRGAIWLMGLEVQNWKHVEVDGRLERDDRCNERRIQGIRLHVDFRYLRLFT